jgi:hypothetical protein
VIRVPIFCVGTVSDHVEPWHSTYKINYQTDTEVTYLLTTGGHNAGIVSEPGHARRSFQVMTREHDDHYRDPETFLAQAPRKDGPRLRTSLRANTPRRGLGRLPWRGGGALPGTGRADSALTGGARAAPTLTRPVAALSGWPTFTPRAHKSRVGPPSGVQPEAGAPAGGGGTASPERTPSHATWRSFRPTTQSTSYLRTSVSGRTWALG